MAYNDEQQNNLRLKHFFFPGLLFFGLESILAAIILVLLNLSSIGSNLLDNNADQTNPVDFAAKGLGEIWHQINQIELFMHVSIFFLWAIAGALGYLLIFSIFKAIYGLIYSAEEAAGLVKKNSAFGLVFWLFSLNDFFKSLLAKLGGTLLLLIGTFIFFSYASSLLKIGIIEGYPAIIYLIAGSLLIAIIGMRFLVSGVGLLIPSFRRWYYD